MREIPDQHVKRNPLDYLQGVALHHVGVRHVLAEESDEPFIKFDNCEAFRSRKFPRDGADSGSDFHNVICGLDVCCCNQPRQLLGRYQEVLVKLRVCAGSDLAVTLHYPIIRGRHLVRHSASLLAPEGKAEPCHTLLAGEVCSAGGLPCGLKRLPTKAGATAGLFVPQNSRCRYQLAPAEDRHDGDTGSVSRWLASQSRIVQIELLPARK